MAFNTGQEQFEYEVKSCGQRHAWCKVCRPDIAERQRKPKPPRRDNVPPCRNCGTCDRCLGLIAPDGFKICRKCHETKPLDQFDKRTDTNSYRNQCHACRHPNPRKPGMYRGPDGPFECMCVECGAKFLAGVPMAKYCPGKDCKRIARNRANREKWPSVRDQALYAYSGEQLPSCACCGESGRDFLVIDHINGGGNKQHKELGGGGFYGWLKKNHYPSGFQILCHNCNMARQHNGGHCPAHKHL